MNVHNCCTNKKKIVIRYYNTGLLRVTRKQMHIRSLGMALQKFQHALLYLSHAGPHVQYVQVCATVWTHLLKHLI